MLAEPILDSEMAASQAVEVAEAEFEALAEAFSAISLNSESMDVDPNPGIF